MLCIDPARARRRAVTRLLTRAATNLVATAAVTTIFVLKAAPATSPPALAALAVPLDGAALLQDLYLTEQP